MGTREIKLAFGDGAHEIRSLAENVINVENKH